MPISPADLRGMLRADAVGLVLGLLLMLAALATLVLGIVLRRRAVSLLWLGAFSLLYGSRLLERAAIVRLSFDVPTVFWERIDAAMTYAVPIPIAHLRARHLSCLASLLDHGRDRIGHLCGLWRRFRRHA